MKNNDEYIKRLDRAGAIFVVSFILPIAAGLVTVPFTGNFDGAGFGAFLMIVLWIVAIVMTVSAGG